MDAEVRRLVEESCVQVSVGTVINPNIPALSIFFQTYTTEEIKHKSVFFSHLSKTENKQVCVFLKPVFSTYYLSRKSLKPTILPQLPILNRIKNRLNEIGCWLQQHLTGYMYKCSKII